MLHITDYILKLYVGYDIFVGIFSGVFKTKAHFLFNSRISKSNIHIK